MTVQQRLEDMSTIAHKNQQVSKNKQKVWYDKHTKHREFTEGDYVLVLAPRLQNKLEFHWSVPYTIVKKVSPVTYMIDMPEKRKRHRVCHVNRLKPWHTPVADVLYCNPISDGLLETSTDIRTWDDSGLIISPHLSADQRFQLEKLLHDYDHILSEIPGKTTLFSHKINTDSASPISVPPRRTPPGISGYYHSGIENYDGSRYYRAIWRFPLVFVPKKDGSLRLCVDYRQLNVKSMSDTYPMPRADDLIDRIGNANYITTLDLTKWYYQVPMDEESKEKTAFATPIGLYQFWMMPFGLKGAPTTFQRLMDHVLRELDFSDAFFDDMEIRSPDWDSHLYVRYLLVLNKLILPQSLRNVVLPCHIVLFLATSLAEGV